jgi:NADPH:quinone reductase-like Zn-dependent oxidoreductase
MKAAVYRKYGPPSVLHITEVPKPIPKDNEVLIKVKATTVTTAEVKVRGLVGIPPLFYLPTRLAFGLFKPRKPILGAEFAGVIEGMGKSARLFKEGDEVFGFHVFGASAEYMCMDERELITHKPRNVNFEEAASIPFGSLNSLYFLRKCNLQQGERVLIIGAGGALGCSGVQLAKEFGATVTGVCSSRHVREVAQLGADEVIDYTVEDFTKRHSLFDVIYDTVGATSYKSCKRLLKPEGFYLNALFGGSKLLEMLYVSVFSKHKYVCGVCSNVKEDIEYIKQLVEDGKLKPVIDKTYTLEEIAEAHQHVQDGHKRGAVVVRVG